MKQHTVLKLVGTAAVLVASGYGSGAIAQATGLEIGGQQANFGVHEVAPGFLPDPMSVNVVSGGGINARSLDLGPGCKGWVTRRPDAIVRLSGRSQRLRFFVSAEGNADTTLIVNHPNGSWRCNDDSWGGLHPTVDIRNAAPGQYDVWVGSYHQGEHAQGALHITELVANHP